MKEKGGVHIDTMAGQNISRLVINYFCCFSWITLQNIPVNPQTCTNFSTRVEELKLRDFNCMLGRVVSCQSSSYRPGNTSRHSCLRLTRNKSKEIPPLMWWISFLCYWNQNSKAQEEAWKMRFKWDFVVMNACHWLFIW